MAQGLAAAVGVPGMRPAARAATAGELHAQRLALGVGHDGDVDVHRVDARQRGTSAAVTRWRDLAPAAGSRRR